MLPPFLAHLGLDPTADDRAIRRAYSRLLKQIDQENDPGGFQALRQAYEMAMHWFASQGPQAGPEPAGAEAPPHEGRAAVPEGAEGRQERAGDAPAAEVGSGSGVGAGAAAGPRPAADVAGRQEAARASEQSAREVFEALREQLAQGRLGTHAEVLAWLKQALDGDRLIDMDARFLFEGGVAALLADGWRPGHEYLFGPAMDCFDWHEDRGRLAAFGRAGAVISAAIDELDFYDSLPNRERLPQRDVIRRLRDGRRPRTSALLRQWPVAERLRRLYPHWLHVITDVGNVERWQGWAQAIPRWRRWLAYTPPLPPDPSKAGTASVGVRRAWMLLAALMCSAFIGMCSAPSRTGAPVAPQASGPLASSGTAPLFDPAAGRAGGSAPGLRFTDTSAFDSPRLGDLGSARQGASAAAVPAVHASLAAPLRPAYPPVARRLGHEGRVVVSATIGADGRVRHASIGQGSGFQELDDAALAAVRDAAFVPARDGMGRPVAGSYRIPIRFTLSPDPAPVRAARPRDYAQSVRDTFRPHIRVQDAIAGNPVAEVTLRMNAQGVIESHRLSRPSGNKDWDDAVLGAVRRVSRVPPEMVITFRPKA
ncbi:TonB family protein [Paracidovorax anthurii]|uniref:Outer membrane transport energization protein TonB n=1 Tax=Paracidovorax anthurii TaxID=78229 RepID=A0A328Z3N4_9BURK|nr:TonB family protein [Paracidovorax anthurii]RAR80710.1 outer membrane transport energization protein TonB [Paracidovorax anthurii]